MKITEHGISNMSVYVNRMQKSVLDKMFFMDKVFERFSTVVDFGCANGELIKALKLLFGDYRYVGYDISDDMIAAAKENAPFCEFYNDWNAIDADFSDSLLNISSTLHEVYSYNTEKDIEIFWSRVFGSGFKYVAIRDMMFSARDREFIDQNQLNLVRSDTKYADKLADFERIQGKITTQHDLAHYLLKYKYTENWEREVRENYVPIDLEALLERVPDSYEITYLNHFTLPFTAWQIRNDFGIDLKTFTHIKLILKRKD